MSRETYSPESYGTLLEALAPHTRDGDFTNPPEEGVLLRHDVDYCLATAAELAAINRAHAVAATFFVLVSSPLYNIFSAEDRQALRAIIDNGQHVGLHYHHTGGPLDADRLKREFAALRLAVPEAQRVVAWHNPEGDLGELNRQAEGLGFISAYAPALFGEGRYVSDSNCRHTPREILDFQREAAGPVQVLLHPFIWVHGGHDMQTVLARTFRARLEATAQTFAENKIWKDGAGRSILSRFNLDG